MLNVKQMGIQRCFIAHNLCRSVGDGGACSCQNFLACQAKHVKVTRGHPTYTALTCESPWNVDRSTERYNLDMQSRALRSGGYHIPCKSAGESVKQKELRQLE